MAHQLLVWSRGMINYGAFLMGVCLTFSQGVSARTFCSEMLRHAQTRLNHLREQSKTIGLEEGRELEEQVRFALKTETDVSRDRVLEARDLINQLHTSRYQSSKRL